MIKKRTTTIFELDCNGNVSHQRLHLYQEFNKRGYKINETTYDTEGCVESRFLYKYNQHGSLIEQVKFDRNNQVLERMDYFFDEDCRLIQTEITLSDESKIIKEHYYDTKENFEKVTINSEYGEIIGYEVFWYNEKKEVIAVIKSDSNSKTKYKKFVTYDTLGQLVMEETFGCNDLFERKINYFYLSNGKLSQIDTQDKNGKVVLIEKYAYDWHNQLVEKQNLNLLDGVGTRIQYNYDLKGNRILVDTYEQGRHTFRNLAKYDGRNNLIEEEIIQSGNPNLHQIWKHEIKYW